MRRLSILAPLVALAAVTGAATGRAATSAGDGTVLAPCQRLAELARAKPDGPAWSSGYRRLAPDLRIQPFREPQSAFEKALAASRVVKEALPDAATAGASVEQLGAGDVYMAYAVAGTLECEDTAFLKAPRAARAQVIAAPPRFSDLCWTSSGGFGSVFGTPAFVETETFTVAEPARETVETTPWSGSGWAPACRLTLDYRTEARLTEQFCGDLAACRRVAPLAVAIAEAHRKPRKEGEPFAFGPVGDDAALARVKAVMQSTDTSDFPTFGAKAKTQFAGFSYNDFDLFPLTVDGVTYGAAIGYGGVGWREIGDALLAVYEVDGDSLKPVAGFVVARRVVGLDAATADQPPPYQDEQ